MLTPFVLAVAVGHRVRALVVGIARLDKGALGLEGRRRSLKRVGSVTFSRKRRDLRRVRQRI